MKNERTVSDYLNNLGMEKASIPVAVHGGTMNLEVQLSKTDPSEALRRYISRRLHFSLGRFGGRVGRLDVRIDGAERMRGNQNHCRIDAEIVPFGHVTIQETNPDMYVAIDRATTRIGRLFARELARIRDIRVRGETVRAA
jgi:putative sigma-54 modulation protein